MIASLPGRPAAALHGWRRGASSPAYRSRPGSPHREPGGGLVAIALNLVLPQEQAATKTIRSQDDRAESV
jgi:hypothetical protein